MSSSIKNVSGCIVSPYIWHFFPLSVLSQKCGFLRKTVIHSSCCLSQDSESSEHQIQQSLGKPTNNHWTLWGKFVQRPAGSFSMFSASRQWNSFCEVGGKRPPPGGNRESGNRVAPHGSKPFVGRAYSARSLGLPPVTCRWIRIQNQSQNMQRNKPPSVKTPNNNGISWNGHLQTRKWSFLFEMK